MEKGVLCAYYFRIIAAFALLPRWRQMISIPPTPALGLSNCQIEGIDRAEPTA